MLPPPASPVGRRGGGAAAALVARASPGGACVTGVVVGADEAEPAECGSLEAVWGQLGPRWAAMCRAADSAKFHWSHDGVKKQGWVELAENGRLGTTWVEGSWKVMDDVDVVEMNFGSSRHLCRFREGGFIVEEKFLIRTGKVSYKPNQAKSCGFIRSMDDTSTRGAPTPRKQLIGDWVADGPGQSGQKRRRGVLDGDREEVPKLAFSQKDLRLDAFFSGWEAWSAKRFGDAAKATAASARSA
mmetsp:Transcript_69601/g.226654  ORF Transcript_69601/g.226654 Transcript_69601/m.226654 type:complete len:243 (-) Transcript_69601:130-858(-)